MNENKKFEIEKTLLDFSNRMLIANRADSSITSYKRAVRRLYEFHKMDVNLLEIDQIIDFLTYLMHEHQLNWRSIKMYVAGLRYFYTEMALKPKLAMQIPYPKEKPSLPQIASREELALFFSGCVNRKSYCKNEAKNQSVN